MATSKAKSKLKSKAKSKAWSKTYHTKNSRLLKGWLVQTSNPLRKVSWEPYSGKADIRRGTTPAQAWWWLFPKKQQAQEVKKELLAHPDNKSMKVKVQYRPRLRIETYYY